MLEKILDFLENIKRGKKSLPDYRNDSIVLKIVANNKVIAFLSTENSGKVFTLVYADHYLESGIPPLNLKPGEMPELGKTYTSEILWYPFAARVPSPSRPDFESEMARAGLTGDEPVLEIIGRLSKTSISRSWTFEIDKAA